MSYGFNNDELSKLFADAGAAVNKAKKVHTPAPAPTPQAPVHQAPVAKKAPTPAPPPVEEDFTSAQIDGGTLDSDGLNLRLKDGTEVGIFFANVKGLSAGRIGSSQIIGWKCGKKIYYAVYKEINLKGMIPKMGFQVSENWKNFIIMMSERAPGSADEGIVIAKKPMGILPAYDSKDLFFEHIKGL